MRTRMAVCRSRMRVTLPRTRARISGRAWPSRQNRESAKRRSLQGYSRSSIAGAKRQSEKRTALELCSNAVLNVEYWRKPVAFFWKSRIPIKDAFRFGKMISSFKKDEMLRFADCSRLLRHATPLSPQEKVFRKIFLGGGAFGNAKHRTDNEVPKDSVSPVKSGH